MVFFRNMVNFRPLALPYSGAALAYG
jgi:hypothetical protein